jgi:hypothetical protein
MATDTEVWKRIAEQVKIYRVVAPRGGGEDTETP